MFFRKEYKEERISRSILELYHMLHERLSKTEKEIYFGEIMLNGQMIDTWKIRILELDPE